MGFREHKLAMRRRLHDRMKVPALLLENAADYIGTSINVRVHTKWEALGDQKGTSFNSAEFESLIPKLVLWRSELPEDVSFRNRIVYISSEEAYVIDHDEEPDGPTVTVHVKPMNPEKVAALAVAERVKCCDAQ